MKITHLFCLSILCVSLLFLSCSQTEDPTKTTALTNSANPPAPTISATGLNIGAGAIKVSDTSGSCPNNTETNQFCEAIGAADIAYIWLRVDPSKFAGSIGYYAFLCRIDSNSGNKDCTYHSPNFQPVCEVPSYYRASIARPYAAGTYSLKVYKFSTEHSIGSDSFQVVECFD
jgi:hypothetical protein